MAESERSPSSAIMLRNQIKVVNQDPGDLTLFTDQERLGYLTSTRRPALMGNLEFLSKFPLKKALAIREALTTLEKNPQRKHYSLFDVLAESQSLRQTNNLFDEITGALVLPDGQALVKGSPVLANFYNSRRVFATESQVELRGANYFVTMDKKNKDVHSKFKIISEDLVDAINRISQVKREDIKDSKDYLLYLGMLDYLKMHTATIYHALTYNERYGLQSVQQTDSYKFYKEMATTYLLKFTRVYYQALLGLDFDQPKSNPVQDKHNLTELLVYTETQVQKSGGHHMGKPWHRFRYPEVNNPLVIALGAEQAVKNNPDTNLILGVPSGGTETAIVAQLIAEQILKSSPELMLLPVTYHSEARKEINTDEIVALIQRFYPDLVEGKNILMIDDNASSGRTLESITQALTQLKAAKLTAHLAEFDGRKLTSPESSIQNNTYFNYQQSSPSTMGIAHLDSVNQHEYKNKIEEKLRGS